jgi:hypothetical protein
MSDVNNMRFSEEEEPELEVLVPGRDEIPEEPEADPEFKDLSKEDVIQKLREEQETRRSLEGKVDSVSAITSGLEKLNQNLVRPVVQQPAPQQVQQELSEEEKAKLYNESLLDGDVYSKTVNLVNDQLRKLRPDLEAIMQANLVHSKKFALLDPDVADVMKLHGQEVEAEVASLPPSERIKDPDVYEKAARRVSVRYVDEIVERKVQEVLKAKGVDVQGPSQGGGGGGPTMSTSVPFTETNQRPNPKKRTVIPTREQMEEARVLGMTIEKYMEMEV